MMRRANSTTRSMCFKGRSARSINAIPVGSRTIHASKQTQAIDISILCIAAVAGCLSLSALAQTSNPTPLPAPMSPTGSSMPQFFDRLIGQAGALIPQ
jgi:hypothetical protein